MIEDDYIKCTGHNENRLPTDEFQRLFIEECRLLGEPVRVNIFGSVAIGLVKKVIKNE